MPIYFQVSEFVLGIGGAPCTERFALFAQDAPGIFDFGGALIPILIIGILFYVMLIRPERQKRAQVDEMLKKLKKNDKVVTAGGILGTVVNIQQGSEEVTVRVHENTNTKLHVLRSSIARVITDEGNTETDENTK